MQVDHDIAEILSDLNSIKAAHSHDVNLMTICGFLGVVMPQLYKAKGVDYFMWKPTSLRCRDDRRRKEIIRKIQRAYQFIAHSQRQAYETIEDFPELSDLNRLVQVDFVCDLAREVIGLLPSIGDQLDCFAVEPGIQAECLHKNVIH